MKTILNRIALKVQYYTKPSITPTGVTEGSKVYKNVMISCVIYLD
ncbi:hypothetical protein [Oceanobacillus piezotolerans]|nr:hypothetical protein [Oceanobacillus piezotolerans]